MQIWPISCRGGAGELVRDTAFFTPTEGRLIRRFPNTITSSKSLCLTTSRLARQVNPSDPHFFRWVPVQPLPEYCNGSHLPNSGKRVVQSLAHRFVVPLLDPLRYCRKDCYMLEDIEPEVHSTLRAAFHRRGGV